MIKILDSNLNRQGVIKKTINPTRFEELNGENTLNFTVILDNKFSGLLNENSVFELDNDYFDIAYYKKNANSDDTYIVDVETEHISYRLNDPVFNIEYFTEIGTPTYILSKILEGTGFTTGTVEYTEVTTYSVQEAKSRRQLLMEFVAHVGGEAYFDKFEIGIVQHRGSLVSKPVIKGKNVTVVSKIFNKRETDKDGNPLVSYTCEPIYLPGDEYGLGDEVLLIQKELGIEEQLRVARLSYDPYDKINVVFELANYINGLEDQIYRIETSSLIKSKIYYGARISPENGFESIRSDKMARTVMNADTFAMQVGDGSGSSWTNKLYFDPTTNKYVFDGELSANIINALSVLITPNLYADKGYIAELTVDMLDTGNKVLNYLNEDTSDVNYIKIYDQYLQFITASTDGSATVQATNRSGATLYWIDETHTAATTTVTDYPVMIFTYTELIKMQVAFVNDGLNYTPQIVMGAGSGNTQDSGKTFLYKAADGFYIDYRHSVTGESSIFKITDDGIDLSMFPTVTFNEIVVANVPRVWVQDDEPAAAKAEDLWVETDDFSRYDKYAITSDTTLLVSSYEFVTANGTFNITLHAATQAGIIKKIYNVGTGIITIIGTINGKTNLLLFPGESVELITDGTAWRY